MSETTTDNSQPSQDTNIRKSQTHSRGGAKTQIFKYRSKKRKKTTAEQKCGGVEWRSHRNTIHEGYIMTDVILDMWGWWRLGLREGKEERIGLERESVC
jgi:hypothetical protein